MLARKMASEQYATMQATVMVRTVLGEYPSKKIQNSYYDNNCRII